MAGVVTDEQRALRKQNKKRCTGPCGQIKDIRFEFYHTKRNYLNGTVGVRIDSKCISCRRQQTTDYIASLTPEERRRKRREWHANMDQEKRLATERDYARMMGQLTGKVKKPRGPYRRAQQDRDPQVPRAPLDAWLDEMRAIRGLDNRDLQRITELDESTFRPRGRKLIRLSAADDICTKLGRPDIARALWPDT